MMEFNAKYFDLRKKKSFLTDMNSHEITF
jgi:hypothetical protein